LTDKQYLKKPLGEEFSKAVFVLKMPTHPPSIFLSYYTNGMFALLKTVEENSLASD
jgi:hypothetical protein